MTYTNDVHWHEGLFLQPHHLQALQRNMADRLAVERRLAWSYPYGVVDMKVSPDALDTFIIQFDQLRAVLPSGLEIRVPENAELPAVDFKEAFQSSNGAVSVMLGVPIWHPERSNTIDTQAESDWRTKKLYRLAEISKYDENTGENPQPMLIRKINARLLIGDEDRTDLEVLPLLKIVHGAGDEVGRPRIDPTFVPPTMVLGGSPVLRDLVRDLANQIAASRKELVRQITQAGFTVDNMRGIQLEQILRLRTLNGFSARLSALIQAESVSPFEVYVDLRQLLGELTALYPDRDQFETAKYDHDNPSLAFHDLANKIRSLLRGSVQARFLRVPFVPAPEGQLAQLTVEHLTQPNEYFLGIRTREEPQVLAMLVEDPNQFKLMPKSLATRMIFGVRLALERVPPLELPAESGLTYFRLLRGESARMWERIQEEKAIAARWPGMETSDFKLTLYMTVPNLKEGA